MPRQLLVFGDKTFRITVPDDAKLSFAPFSPPRKGGWPHEALATGTLRVYKGTKENIIACFADVRGFRDLSLDFSELVAKEEGAAIWKHDHEGYRREENVKRSQDWAPDVAVLAAPEPKRKHK